MAEATHVRISAAEFARLEETTIPAMLLNGEVIVSPTPKRFHQKLAYALAKMIEIMANRQGEINIAPLDVYLDEHNVLQPDVFWVAGPQSLCQLGKDDYWHGAPDLVVEVLSPSTARYDRAEKFRLYEQHGTLEYWLVDPQAQYVEVWRRAAEKFERQGVFGPEDSFESSLLGGKQVKLAGLFAD